MENIRVEDIEPTLLVTRSLHWVVTDGGEILYLRLRKGVRGRDVPIGLIHPFGRWHLAVKIVRSKTDPVSYETTDIRNDGHGWDVARLILEDYANWWLRDEPWRFIL